MNDSKTTSLANEQRLDRYIEAACAVDDAELAAATTQFRASLPEAKPSRQSMFSWLRLAGVAAALMLTISLLPFLTPGQPGTSAFAQAQAWFESYRSLHFLMTMTHNGQPLTTVEVWTDETGATRIEMPPVTHIVIPVENVMHTLMPGGQVMTKSLGIGAADFELGDGMEWLDELRTFQGMAGTVDSPRRIDGIDALGWRLVLSTGTHTLWVDPADNRPLLLEAGLAGGMQMESVFEFDQPLSADLFKLPGGHK